MKGQLHDCKSASRTPALTSFYWVQKRCEFGGDVVLSLSSNLP